MVVKAQKTLADVAGHFTFAAADAQELPFAGGTFKVIVANHMLLHVQDIDRAVAEMRRMLKTGGRAYATTNSREHLRELHASVYNT